MAKSNNLYICNEPHSIKSVAKVLDREVETIIRLLYEGKIRACVQYLDYAPRFPYYSAAYVGNDIHLKTIFDGFHKNTLMSHESGTDDYPTKQVENDDNACPLAQLFSTFESTISIRSCQLQNKNTAVISADIKGLWQVKLTAEVQYIINNPNHQDLLVTIVPYISDGPYHLQINEQKGGHLAGFAANVSLDDIRVSFDDIKRIEAYLAGQIELEYPSLQNTLTTKPIIKPFFTPKQQSSMAYIQLINSNTNFAPEFTRKPNATYKLIDDKLSEYKMPAMRLSINTFRYAIAEGKKLLSGSISPNTHNSETKPRELFIHKCEALLLLIKIHPLIEVSPSDSLDSIYSKINQVLSVQGMETFKMDIDTFQNVYERSQ